MVTQPLPVRRPRHAEATAVAMPDAGSVTSPLPRARRRAWRPRGDGAMLRGACACSATPPTRCVVDARARRRRPPAARRRAAGRLLRAGDPARDRAARARASRCAGRRSPAPGFPIAGRGSDFAWSVTTAQGDNTDVFAEKLCEPTVVADYVSTTSARRCVPFTVQGRELRWSPGPADLLQGGRMTPYDGTIAHPALRARAGRSRPARSRGRPVRLHPRALVVSATRSTRPLGLSSSPTAAIERPARLPACDRAGQRLLQLVLRRREAHRLRAVGELPAPREGHRRRPADVGHAADSSGAARSAFAGCRRPSTPSAATSSRGTRSRRRAGARPTPTGSTAACTARSASSAGCAPR